MLPQWSPGSRRTSCAIPEAEQIENYTRVHEWVASSDFDTLGWATISSHAARLEPDEIELGTALNAFLGHVAVCFRKSPLSAKCMPGSSETYLARAHHYYTGHSCDWPREGREERGHRAEHEREDRFTYLKFPHHQ